MRREIAIVLGLVRRVLARDGTLPAARAVVASYMPERQDGRRASTAHVAADLRRLPSDAVIVQRAPAATETTIELASACRGTSRLLYTEWPHEDRANTARHAEFIAWHRAVIAHELLPFVRIVPEAESLLARSGLVVPGESAGA